ncbi:MAG: hypothetical protein ABIG60_00750 [Patescibacteria group bacterium]
MEIIQNSKDLLYIVIAFCILWLTVFVAWFIYYLIMIMRQVFQIIKEVREKINKVDKAIKDFKDKVEHGTAYLALISEGVKKLTKNFHEKGGKKKK